MNIYIESTNLNKQTVNFSDGSYLDFQIALINNNKGEPVALKTDNLFFFIISISKVLIFFIDLSRLLFTTFCITLIYLIISQI